MGGKIFFTITDWKIRSATFFVIMASVFAVAMVSYFFDWRSQFDFDLRYYEISCAHEGVDPFKVWDRQVETDRFIGWDRPDRPNIPKKDDQHYVHAYPPWQTSFFYWYAWVPHDLMSGIVRIANIIMFFVIMLCMLRWCKALSEWKKFFVIASHCLYFFYDALQVTILGNYGILIALLLMAFYRALDLGHDKTAGVIWAVAMIKPQLTLLLFWPLLIQRKYKVIIVAMLTCFVATLWPAYLYGTSPIDLILEIPKLGAPYVGLGSAYRPPALTLFEYLFGSNGVYVLAFVCFCVCGVLCYKVRHCSDWWMRAVPAIAMIPYWTYTQQMDQIAAWSVVLVVLFVSLGCFCHCASRRFSLVVAVMWGGFLLSQLLFVLIRIISSSRLCDESSSMCIVPAAKLLLIQDILEGFVGVMQFVLFVVAVIVVMRISFCNRAMANNGKDPNGMFG